MTPGEKNHNIAFFKLYLNNLSIKQKTNSFKQVYLVSRLKKVQTSIGVEEEDVRVDLIVTNHRLECVDL